MKTKYKLAWEHWKEGPHQRSFPWRMVFKLKPESSVRVSQVRKARKRVLGKGDGMCKGPEAKKMLVYLRN